MGFKFGDCKGYVVVEHSVDYYIISDKEGEVPKEILKELTEEYVQSRTFGITENNRRYVIIRV